MIEINFYVRLIGAYLTVGLSFVYAQYIVLEEFYLYSLLYILFWFPLLIFLLLQLPKSWVFWLIAAIMVFPPYYKKP